MMQTTEMRPRSDAVVVVPSVRTLTDEWLAPFDSVDVLVVDGGGFTDPPQPRPNLAIWNPRARAGFNRPADELVGYGSAACRNIGVWRAWREGYAQIWNIDDDCYGGHSFAEDAMARLGTAQQYEMRDPDQTGWLNPLQSRYYPRGFPYDSRLQEPPHWTGFTAHAQPVVHLGLWRGVPDLNAVDRLAVHDKHVEETLPKQPYVAMGLLPVCAMNLLVTRAYAPFIYQIPWASFDPTCGLERYDDIIGGLFTCALAWLCLDAVTVGPPYVEHRQAAKDQYALAAQENFGNTQIAPFAKLLLAAMHNCPRNAPKNHRARLGRMRTLLDELDACALGHPLEVVVYYVTLMYRRWLANFEEN